MDVPGRPMRNETGHPCRLPEGVVRGVLMSCRMRSASQSKIKKEDLAPVSFERELVSRAGLTACASTQMSAASGCCLKVPLTVPMACAHAGENQPASLDRARGGEEGLGRTSEWSPPMVTVSWPLLECL